MRDLEQRIFAALRRATGEPDPVLGLERLTRTMTQVGIELGCSGGGRTLYAATAASQQAVERVQAGVDDAVTALLDRARAAGRIGPGLTVQDIRLVFDAGEAMTTTSAKPEVERHRDAQRLVTLLLGRAAERTAS